MRNPRILLLAGLLAAAPGVPNSEPESAFTVREFSTPVLSHPGGVAAAPDGAVWIASTHADKLVRFDPDTGRAAEIKLPLRTQPMGIVVDRGGSVWFAASGSGVVGRLDAGSDRVKEFAIPALLMPDKSAFPAPWALAVDPGSDRLWLTVHSDGSLGYLSLQAEPQRRKLAVSEIRLGEAALRPDGIAVDGRGEIWVAELGADRLAHISDPAGCIQHLPLPRGSRPRGVAASPDGSIWVTLFGTHELARVDPVSQQIRRWPMPSGKGSSPWGLAVDRAGVVWVAEFLANSIARFDPRTNRFTVIPLPTPRSGVKALTVDSRGRVWFVGSTSGRLGVIE